MCASRAGSWQIPGLVFRANNRSYRLQYKQINNSLLKDVAAYFVIGIAVVFLMGTIRSGHDWGGDFALYIAHAINIQSGQPYADTGFVYNPEEPLLSPRSYPPIYPLFLAPIYKFFGLDLYAMKIANILAFAAFLVVFYRYASKRLESQVGQVLVIVALAFSPWYWLAKDQILPDFVFILLFYLTIVIMEKISVPRKFGWNGMLLAVTAGFSAYLAYGVRSLGLPLMPALVMSDVIRHRRISLTTLIAAVVFGIFYLTQNAILETDQSYLDSYKHVMGGSAELVDNVDAPEAEPVDISRTISRAMEQLKISATFYHQNMNSFWFNGINVTLQDVVYVAMGVLAIIGFLGFVIRNPSTADYVLMVYGGILFLVPFYQGRYMLPLIPLYLLYIYRGGEILFVRDLFAVKSRSMLKIVIPVSITVVILLTYLGSYSTRDFGDFTKGVEVKESVEIFDFIRTSVPEDGLVVFRKPRTLALYTGRRSMRYHIGTNQSEFWNSLAEVGATHILVANRGRGIIEEHEFLVWIDESQNRLSLIFENADFRLFRINTRTGQAG
jgi:hypothetical protein